MSPFLYLIAFSSEAIINISITEIRKPHSPPSLMSTKHRTIQNNSVFHLIMGRNSGVCRRNPPKKIPGVFQNARLRENHGQVQATPLAGPAQAEAENVTRLGSKEFFEQVNCCYP